MDKSSYEGININVIPLYETSNYEDNQGAYTIHSADASKSMDRIKELVSSGSSETKQ